MTDAQFLNNRFGDRYLYEVNRGAFDQIGSDAVFRRHFGESLWDPDTLNVVIGSDSGLLPRYVLRHGIPSGSRFIFIEPAHLLAPIRGQLGEDALQDPLHMADPATWQSLGEQVHFEQYAFIEKIRVLPSVAAADAYLPEYRSLLLETQSLVQAYLWKVRASLGDQLFIQRQLENLLESQTPAAVLKGAFAGRTAVLLGGGPSLDELLPWIETHRDALTVIAVSRICRRLLEAETVPDVVVSIDPNMISFDVSKEMLRLHPATLFVHANHVSFHLLAQWPGPSVYLGPLLPWDSPLNADNLSAYPPTVTNTALSLAVDMGFERILLAGVDLCHNAGGFSHARGSNEHDTGPRLDTLGFKVETNAGEQAATTPDFHHAIGFMEKQAQSASARGCKIVNLAPGAARMDSVEFVPAEAVTLRPDAHPAARLLGERVSDNDVEQRIRRLQELDDELLHTVRRLGEIKKLAQQALEFNKGLFGRRQGPADFKYKKRMDRIEHRLDTGYKTLSVLVKKFSAREFLRMPPSDREWTDAEIEQAGITYYEAYRKGAERLIELIGTARRRLAVAAEEERPQPDFARLLAQWESDGIPGRARVWRLRHPSCAAALPETVRNQLTRLEHAFEAVLNRSDTGHARRCRSESSLRPVRGKLAVLFRQHDREGLQVLARQLEAKEGREAEELTALAHGYLAELDDQGEAAFGHYARLVEFAEAELDRRSDTGAVYRNPRLEDALRRMVYIAMDFRDTDNALLLLSSLAGMSPPHQPQYADLLRLSGRIAEALEVYTDYLAKAPQDLGAMMKLGKLYQEAGIPAAAREAYGFILRQDPHNQAARTLLQEVERKI